MSAVRGEVCPARRMWKGRGGWIQAACRHVSGLEARESEGTAFPAIEHSDLANSGMRSRARHADQLPLTYSGAGSNVAATGTPRT